ncbi:hypothetical protein [Phocaeicola sp.]
MDKKEIKKNIYHAPVITKQQIVLEQVIAAGSRKLSTDETEAIQHEWIEEEMNNDYQTII